MKGCHGVPVIGPGDLEIGDRDASAHAYVRLEPASWIGLIHHEHVAIEEVQGDVGDSDIEVVDNGLPRNRNPQDRPVEIDRLIIYVRLEVVKFKLDPKAGHSLEKVAALAAEDRRGVEVDVH